MATYDSDDEQLEALRAWWKENGTSLLTGVVLVLLAFFGVRQWQESRAAEHGAASELYQQLADLALASLEEPISADDLLAAQAVYSQLKTDFTASVYTRYAALTMAKFQVEQNALDAAATELQWILDNPGGGLMTDIDQELFLTARLRLARVRLAQGMAQQALELLRGVEPGSFAASYAEAEGDALVSLGERDAARAAYQRALAGVTDNPGLLPLKLQDLGVDSAAAL